MIPAIFKYHHLKHHSSRFFWRIPGRHSSHLRMWMESWSLGGETFPSGQRGENGDKRNTLWRSWNSRDSGNRKSVLFAAIEHQKDGSLQIYSYACTCFVIAVLFDVPTRKPKDPFWRSVLKKQSILEDTWRYQYTKRCGWLCKPVFVCSESCKLSAIRSIENDKWMLDIWVEDKRFGIQLGKMLEGGKDNEWCKITRGLRRLFPCWCPSFCVLHL